MNAILHTSFLSRERAAPRIPVERIVHPASVAVFGASDSKDKFGGRIMNFLVRHGFAGDIFPINPRRDEVLGRKAYPSIGAAPKAPDVAILAVPAGVLVQSIAEAAEAGVGCCVIMTTGFAEAGEEGAAKQAELVEIVRRTGMRIVGPNCMGLIVPHHRMALCSSVVLDTDTLRDGSISLVSQSGALMVSIFDRASSDGIGFRTCVSLGNQSDLELCDFIEYLVGDAGTKAICLYVEGFLDPARFRRAAAAARVAGKPLLLVKTGRTPAGVKSARSHTASLAGSFESFAAVCREEGVVIARDPDDMIRAAHFLVRYPGPRGDGVGVLSTSGGGAGIAVDRLSEAGFRLATLAPQTRATLDEMLLAPQADNPIDLGGRKKPEEIEIAGDAARAMFTDPDVAYGMAILTSMPFFVNRSRLIAEEAIAAGKPVMIVLTPGAAADAPRKAVTAVGGFHFNRIDDALTVLGLMVEHERLRSLPRATLKRPSGLPAAPPAKLPSGLLTEPEVKRLVAAYGVPVTREREAATPAAAAAAATAIGFPVVLKAVSRSIIHKSDAGGVRLNLGDAAAVETAAATMAARIGPERLDGFVVAEMIRGEAEVIIGVRRDPQFGPIVLVGLGGIAVEIIGDVAMAPAPVTAARAREMIDRLKLAPLLKGARGKPVLDIGAVADAIVRLSWLAADLGPRLVDLEINPILVRADGEGAVAVDGRANLEAGG